MTKSTDRRRQILAFIQCRVETDGRPPTLDEIATACGLASRSAAQKHVRALEASGDLQVTPGTARGARPKPKLPADTRTARRLFEVSARDIAELSDTDLRALVARLCIARIADAGLPPDFVTRGGDQRAPDGGIDVRVQLSDENARRASFARSSVGFQVKAMKMGNGDIQREMCPSGLLRPSIRELLLQQGAYVIATSDTVSDSEYKKRVAAMRAAASSPEEPQALFDYYDSQRLADWTNRHPGVVAWVRSRLARPLQGWQPHGKWTDTRGGKAQAFLPDDKNRLLDPLDREHALPLVEGLRRVRSALRTGGRSVRLIGLSGVGKTRFAQALFEETAAPEALAADLAVYCDTSHSPEPPPLALLDELLATQRRAILIVDNCGSQLHTQLTARCKVSDRVSLLTIEYDIREDLPLETNVFQLEAASPELIEKVIEQQFPHISQVNVQTITKFADGNSRVAIALANTMDTNDSLAGLTDRGLFDRLFWLGKEVQPELKVAAEVCALVYSFDGEDIDGELSELAALAGMPAHAIYRWVNELQQRGLVQRRGRWRAVLPHAIANTLATHALEAIPYTLIQQRLVAPQGRLLRSFSRRLGYLHRSQVARNVVRDWLSNSGLLNDVAGLSPLLLDVLIYVAPVDPAAALQAVKRGVTGHRSDELLALSHSSRPQLVRLVRSIAYDQELFEECLEVLVAFARVEPEDTRTDRSREVIASLFPIYLSGTHATKSQRAEWIRNALRSGDAHLEEIGFKALSSALECHHFSSMYEFEFGARVRDYGAYPLGTDIKDWFQTFIDLDVDVAQSGGPWADEARDLLARHFRSLWSVAGMADALEAAVGPLLDEGWEQGWLAIRQTLRLNRKTLRADHLSRLRILEERARPQTLVARVKAIVLSRHLGGVDFADGESPSSGYERAEEMARELGELVAADTEAFKKVLHLVVTNQQGRHWMFGRGLANKVASLEECWRSLEGAFDATPKEQRNVQVLRGFLQGASERDHSVFERLLDDAMTSPSLAMWVPVLQLSAPLDDRGCARLMESMANPAVPAWVFQHLSLGRATHGVEDSRLAELLQRLSIKQDGLGVAIEVLFMHNYNNPAPIGPRVGEVARSLIANAPLARSHGRLDHELAGVIEKFAAGREGEPAARKLLAAVRSGSQDYTVSIYDLTESLGALFRVQPTIALDMLVGDETDDGRDYVRYRLAGGRRSSALANIPIEALLQWCRDGMADRWARVAPLVPAFTPGGPEEALGWSERIVSLLQTAPEPIKVAASIVHLIEPTSWSGSRAEAIRRRLPLLDDLARILGPEHVDQVAEWRSQVMLTMEREVRRELEEHRARNERFE